MQILVTVLLGALSLFRIALIGRLIFDWVRAMNPSFKPKGLVLVIAELFYLATDWIVKPLARWIKPVRAGSVYLDLSVLVLFGLVFLAQVFLTSIA